MPRETERWGLRRERSADFSLLLPTRLPGISFTGRGRIWFRRDASKPGKDISAAVARAASLFEVQRVASTITQELPPEASFEAEQQIALDLWSGDRLRGDVALNSRRG